MDNIKIKQIIKNFDEISADELYNKAQLQTEIDEKRKRLNKLYPFEENVNKLLLDDEKWLLHPEKKYYVSNLGRIKIDDEILPQKDEGDKPGWLVLSKATSLSGKKLNTTKYIYRFVAETWLDKDEDQDESLGKWHVHHISNDGYDNRPDNLIWVREKLHKKFH